MVSAGILFCVPQPIDQFRARRSRCRRGHGGSITEPHRLDTSLVHGIAWTSTVKWLSQLLSGTCTIVVARGPSHPCRLWVIGMALLLFDLLTLVTELGLGAAVVSKRAVDEQSGRTAEQPFGCCWGPRASRCRTLWRSPSWFLGVPDLRRAGSRRECGGYRHRARAVPRRCSSANCGLER